MLRWQILLSALAAFLVTSQQSYVEVMTEIEPLLRKGFDEFIATGYIEPYFQEIVDKYNFRDLFSQTYLGPRALVDCSSCNIIMQTILADIANGKDQAYVANLLKTLCFALNMQTAEVCNGTIDSQVDAMFYVLTHNPQLIKEDVCGTYVQDENCGIPVNLPNWTVNIAPGVSPDRPRSNFSATPLRILHVSDIHYDPLYVEGTTAVCTEPVCCQVTSNPRPNITSTAGHWGDYRDCDTPWHVIVEAFQHITTQHPNIDFVYYTGDTIYHKVWETSIENNTRDISAIMGLFAQYFTAPVYPILGNHEAHPVDIFASEGIVDPILSTQWLYQNSFSEWSRWLPADTEATILRGGYYSVLVRPGYRVIGLNMNIAQSDNWWILDSYIDPHGQLQWLADQLLAAEQNGESVHILGHIPNGSGDIYKIWGHEYKKIIERFKNTVTAQFKGHTHQDEFQVFYSNDDLLEAINVVWNGGSITPFSNKNPNYKIYTLDPVTFFVAHSNVQQLLASIWYEGLPGFRRKNMVLQALEIVRIGILFPFFSIAYVMAPHSVIGQTMRKPFIKFICHSASYFAFLFMLILASQRIETLFFEEDPEDVPTKRGAKPSLVEWIILAWVGGLIWSEVKQLWDIGLEEYVRDMWNVIDFVTNSLYVATVALRVVSYYQVQKNPKSEIIKREDWDAWDPMLISEGLFSAANIFSSLKLVYIFSVNPHLGPLQVSLSRMVMDIMKFFFLYVLVLFAFSCGLNQLLWYYADAERSKCKTEVCESIFDPKMGNQTKEGNCTSPEPIDSNACTIWRRFANLFETSQTLFWAVFGLVDLESFELSGIKIFTRFWGMLMFGTYSVINIVVLLNLLIAMMNHSYQLISERADVEWKFARSKLWISYFEEGGTTPPPFNVIPTPKSIWYVIQWINRKLCGHSKAAKKEHMRTIRRKVKQASERDFRYQSIMRNLVRRYVTVEQRKAENQGVTEDDVNEIKQDISAFRFELIEILKNSGMNTSTAQAGIGTGTGGKKNRQKERRLMKGFNIGPQPSQTTGPLPPVAEFIASLQQHHDSHHHDGHHHELFGSTLSNIFNSTPRKLHQHSSTVSSSQGSINEGQSYHQGHRGRFHIKRASSHKRRWGTLIEAAKAGKVSRLIGRSRSEDSVCNSHCRENGHNHSQSHSNSPASDENGSMSQSDSNQSLETPIEPPPPPPPVEHHHHHHSLASSLALLKKKRKKFSASRNTSPVIVPTGNAVEHAIAVCLGKNKKVSQVLQRASSVPTRVSEVIQKSNARHEQTQSQQDSVDLPVAESTTLTPSTTEESVTATCQTVLPTGTSSREPLLYNSSSSTQATGSSQTPEEEYKHSGQSLSRLPGVIPLSGHNGPTGWL